MSWNILAPLIKAGSLETQRFLARGTSSAVRSALPANIPDFRSFLEARVLGSTDSLDANRSREIIERRGEERRVYIETYGATHAWPYSSPLRSPEWQAPDAALLRTQAAR